MARLTQQPPQQQQNPTVTTPPVAQSHAVSQGIQTTKTPCVKTRKRRYSRWFLTVFGVAAILTGGELAYRSVFGANQMPRRRQNLVTTLSRQVAAQPGQIPCGRG